MNRLRLTKLNEEMRESEMSSNDDTYNEVFRDYTQLAHSHPERLVRARPHNNNDATNCQEKKLLLLEESNELPTIDFKSRKAKRLSLTAYFESVATDGLISFVTFVLLSDLIPQQPSAMTSISGIPFIHSRIIHSNG
ncbi:unnamed protein product [Leptidea sinapis]|uniref:Uncharacterized protein n=1 Tax=Leptidea sinapis TaxID=189913 RepID=A0A5E4Q1I1_9NEOP|nr:unnamed protein product [Leptidea sinapis]